MPPRAPLRGSMNYGSVFYTPQWTEEIDNLFILALCEQTVVGCYCANGRANRKAIEYAMDRVNGNEGTHMPYNFFLDHFRRLNKRYTVFKFIIEQPGVVHNETTHHITTEESVWNRICREHALAYAYMRQGEAMYDSLEFIFTALPDVSAVGNEGIEIIEISNDHDTMSAEVDNGGVFDSMLAWYNSVGTRDTYFHSTNLQDTGTSGLRFDPSSVEGGGRRRTIPRNPPTSGPSSQVSSSPFKPEW